jgi:hypothetical protein
VVGVGEHVAEGGEDLGVEALGQVGEGGGEAAEEEQGLGHDTRVAVVAVVHGRLEDLGHLAADALGAVVHQRADRHQRDAARAVVLHPRTQYSTAAT